MFYQSQTYTTRKPPSLCTPITLSTSGCNGMVRSAAARWHNLQQTVHCRPYTMTMWIWCKSTQRFPRYLSDKQNEKKTNKLEMWANAERDGHPAEYRWRPLFNAAKFGWCPLLECRAVTLPRRETHWNLQGCPKLAKRSQLLVAEVHHIVRACGGDIGV